MGAYQSASQLLPKPVLAMAREFNYSKENYLILARRNKQLQTLLFLFFTFGLAFHFHLRSNRTCTIS